MKRAALYARVSTDRQADADRNSLPAQREAFNAHCARQGYAPAGEYQDVQRGSVVSRREYQRLLAAVRAGQVDVIVVTFLDRFGRDEWEIMGRIGELRGLGVDVEATEESLSSFLEVSIRRPHTLPATPSLARNHTRRMVRVSKPTATI